MKSQNILTVLAIAVLGYVAYRSFAGGGGLLPGTPRAASTPAPKTYANGFPSQIAYAASPGDAAWGWQYFTDGVAIGPDGKYYLNGNLVWSPS